MNKRNLLAATAAFSLLVGPALAQATVETSRSTTVQGTIGAPVASESTTRTQSTTDAFGNKTESKQSLSVGSGGAESSSETKVKRSDGSSEHSYKEKRSTAPVPPASSSTTSTTTIQR